MDAKCRAINGARANFCANHPQDCAEFAYLTGAGGGTGGPELITDRGCGGKFTPSGEVLQYPGNTFLCHLDPASSAFEVISEAQEILRGTAQAKYFAFLPEPSFHMTVFSGVSGNPLWRDGWPEGVDRQATLAELNELFLGRLNDRPKSGRIRVSTERLFAGFRLEVRPADPDSDSSLRSMRRNLQEATGLTRTNFETYQFHISLAYLLRWMRAQEARALLREVRLVERAILPWLTAIEFDRIEFCRFQTVHHFEPLLDIALDCERSEVLADDP